MKRKISILLIISLLSVSMTACGQKVISEKANPPAAGSANTIPDTTSESPIVAETPVNTETLDKETPETPSTEAPPVTPVITTKNETQTEAVKFETVRQNDSSLEKGKEVVAQEGVNGSKSVVYKITLTDGKETERVVESTSVIKAPVDKIIKVGTKAVVTAPATPVIKTENKTVTKSIPFETIKEDDSSIEKGKEVVYRAGIEGTRTITYKVTYTDGKETARVEIANEITKNPVDELVSVGTKGAEREIGWTETAIRKGLPEGYTTRPGTGAYDVLRGDVRIGGINSNLLAFRDGLSRVDIEALISGASTLFLNKADALAAYEEFESGSSSVVIIGSVKLIFTSDGAFIFQKYS